MVAADVAFSPDAERILAYLCEQWADTARLTTVAQAQAALGLSPDAEVRRALGRYLAANPEVHPTVARWGAPPFALTEDEKLLGRYLTARAVGDAGRCLPDDAAATLGWSRAGVEEGLATLVALGLLTWERDGDAVRYRLAPNLPQRLGPLGLMFHTVEVVGEDRFNVS